MNLDRLLVGVILISNEIGNCPINLLLASGVDCIAVDENGGRFRRRHPSHNGEEFFLTRDALQRSHWICVNENGIVL